MSLRSALVITLFTIGTTLSNLALAGDAETRLLRFLEGLHQMEARLVQTIHSPQKETLEESEGIFWLSRPGRFRLSYTNPYKQLYVADGQRIWMYDKDLAQITVKPQQGALGSTPALLLSGDINIQENFSMEELGLHEGFHWLNLYPKEPDASFDYIRLALEENELRAIEMVDGFGQVTRLFFDQIQRNPTLADSLFKFTPPAGVDVIGEQK
ncbi:MAG: outer membrane lipoprotein chaperone LolA [Gammaproteobacteria bacterium]|nr:outer membrane lipoprotein chaperone LolA [Gammaproteobacteria bacterium]